MTLSWLRTFLGFQRYTSSSQRQAQPKGPDRPPSPTTPQPVTTSSRPASSVQTLPTEHGLYSPGFHRAYRATRSYEGGASNDPDDPGGQTNAGISRRAHPEWAGWTLIDQGAPPEKLEPLVESFYWSLWKQYRLDDVPVDIAPKLFDCIFALGPSVLRQLQHTLGIAETGVMDAQTIEALRRADPARVLAHLRFLQAYVYAKFVSMQPDRRMKFLRGLMLRAVA